MQYHSFSPVTGEYVGSREAQVDPVTTKKKGETHYLLAGPNETATAVPDWLDGHTAVWDGESWKSVPDHRGETWYAEDGTPVIVSELGVPSLLREPPVIPPTRDDFGIAVKVHTDEVAKERGYSDAANAATYIGSTRERYASEALTFVRWRDDVWTKVEEVEAAVMAGQRAMPASVEELIAELPAIVWP